MRVIVGVHRSIAGLRALRTGVEWARELGVPLHAVRAWEAEVTYGEIMAPKLDRARRRAVRDIADAFADISGGEPAGVTVRRVVPFGRPGPALVAYSVRDDDLLLVGRGRHLPWRPSVAGYCARHARCPLLVVPPDALGREAGRRRATRLLLRELSGLTGTSA
ncbi:MULTISPECIES: universal stress protein [Catenuloplanes]|uniref:Nucleotide-binding universal stress UspA family protein n=1 Tax=Catenuloplanes niger TaxID=587534 RepID=A0AAE4CXR0_9ACTN|nr:universal stress protein [Catenuloplanes niger]MDR7327747.1 nucleotide-binding universal stress UspA family protein [Catenuloplanes niger]